MSFQVFCEHLLITSLWVDGNLGYILQDLAEEVDSMISNVTKAIIKGRKKSRREGIAKGKAEVLIKF